MVCKANLLFQFENQSHEKNFPSIGECFNNFNTLKLVKCESTFAFWFIQCMSFDMQNFMFSKVIEDQ